MLKPLRPLRLRLRRAAALVGLLRAHRTPQLALQRLDHPLEVFPQLRKRDALNHKRLIRGDLHGPKQLPARLPISLARRRRCCQPLPARVVPGIPQRLPPRRDDPVPVLAPDDGLGRRIAADHGPQRLLAVGAQVAAQDGLGERVALVGEVDVVLALADVLRRDADVDSVRVEGLDGLQPARGADAVLGELRNVVAAAAQARTGAGRGFGGGGGAGELGEFYAPATGGGAGEGGEPCWYE